MQRPWEVWPFFAAAVAGMFWPVCYLGAAIWSGFGFFRLIRQHGKLKRASGRIFERVKDRRKTRALMFRLTDEEIDAFSKGEDIDRYAQSQGCLRWRIIRTYL